MEILLPVRTRSGWDTAVPEETIFGIASRHHILTGNLISGRTNFQLTDKKGAHFSVAFPSDLNKFFARLVLPINSVAGLIENHTELPYFRPFVSTPRYAKIFRAIQAGSARSSKAILGVNKGMVGRNPIRFCPECGKEDEEDIGIPTWYRVHQLPGVIVCPYHGIPLKVSFELCNRQRREQLFLPNSTQFDLDYRVPSSKLIDEKLLLIARLSAQTLLARNFENSSALLRKQYLVNLHNKGLASKTFVLKKAEFMKEFVNFWSPVTRIDPFSSLFNSFAEAMPWPAMLCHEPRGLQHPLRHLLLIGFLEKDIDSFMLPTAIAINSTVQPARSDSATVELQIRCMNSQGKSLTETAKVIGLSGRTTSSKAARMGIFYARRTLIIKPYVQFMIRSAISAGETVNSIVEETNLPEHVIVKLLETAPSPQMQLWAARFEERRRACRNSVLAALDDPAFTGFWSIRDIVSADFYWLYRNDKKWVMNQKRLIEQNTESTASSKRGYSAMVIPEKIGKSLDVS